MHSLSIIELWSPLREARGELVRFGDGIILLVIRRAVLAIIQEECAGVYCDCQLERQGETSRENGFARFDFSHDTTSKERNGNKHAMKLQSHYSKSLSLVEN